MAPCSKKEWGEGETVSVGYPSWDSVLNIQANALKEDISSKIHFCSSVKAQRKMAVTQPVTQAGFHETLISCPEQS